MKIHLEELTHQRQAIDAILASFPQLDTINQIDKNGLATTSIIANPLIQEAYYENKFIDVKMETGTGKTYTYTRMMYELHQKYGMFKFVIVVPSIAIKEGAKSFLTADYARQHFKKFFPKADLEVGIISSGDFATKRGRKEIPNAIRDFVEADTNNKNQIRVLLLSDKGYLDKDTSSLFKPDYDVNLFGGEFSPIAMLAKTCSIVIIDEPHRMSRDNKTYKNIKEKLKPQMIVRFGATFPEKTEGRDKTKITKTDYYRQKPQFDLTAIDAFNQDLVKGVEIYTPEGISKADAYKVKKVSAKEMTLEYKGTEYLVEIGENLADIDQRFQNGITYVGGNKEKKLSNELEISVGMQLLPDVFSNPYQEVLLSLALDRHFKTERKNFLRDGYKVKTNALFFIDNIHSYRQRTANQSTWLKDTFEKLLKEKLEGLITKEENEEYKSFLKATKNNLSASHGGYFAEDSSAKTIDDKISEEIDVILKNKGKSLGFKDERGNWNTLRFFFSKWTLREGWDNPNVFTIAKLRSSGSEISKLQEVGRGLRLPVDEQGNRLSEGDWFLNFIIDESEKDFAQKLQGEINSGDVEKIVENEEITSAIIEKLETVGYGKNKREIINSLLKEGIIDDNYCVIDSIALRELLPKVKSGKVRKGKTKPKTVKLQTKNWNEIRDFWLQVSERYMIEFKREVERELPQFLEEVLSNSSIFDSNIELSIKVEKIQKGDNPTLVENTIQAQNRTGLGKMPYKDFLRQLSRQTNLPLNILHQAIVKRLKRLEEEEGLEKEKISSLLNKNTLKNIIDAWQMKFTDVFAQEYSYTPLTLRAETSVLKNGNFKTEIAEGLVGTIPVDTEVDERNLFEKVL